MPPNAKSTAPESAPAKAQPRTIEKVIRGMPVLVHHRFFKRGPYPGTVVTVNPNGNANVNVQVDGALEAGALKEFRKADTGNTLLDLAVYVSLNPDELEAVKATGVKHWAVLNNELESVPE